MKSLKLAPLALAAALAGTGAGCVQQHTQNVVVGKEGNWTIAHGTIANGPFKGQESLVYRNPKGGVLAQFIAVTTSPNRKDNGAYLYGAPNSNGLVSEKIIVNMNKEMFDHINNPNLNALAQIGMLGTDSRTAALANMRILEQRDREYVVASMNGKFMDVARFNAECASKDAGKILGVSHLTKDVADANADEAAAKQNFVNGLLQWGVTVTPQAAANCANGQRIALR